MNFNFNYRRPAVIVLHKKQVIIIIGAIITAFVFVLWLPSIIHSKPSKPEKEVRLVIDKTDKHDVHVNSKKEETATFVNIKRNDKELKSVMLRINEPVPWGHEIIYSAGNGDTIDDGAVLTRLFVYDINANKEKKIADSTIKFGEIYEGRFNDRWIVWLDTNQNGTNIIYCMDRNSGKVSDIKTCSFNKPQLRLWGDNIVWVEQKSEKEDGLYLYNIISEEPPVRLESFDNPTYGTCSPAIAKDVVLWVCKSSQNPEYSMIKKLNLGNVSKTNGDELEPELIDPKGFAIYPATNGQVIAWLDNIDPKKASLKITKDGINIKSVANGVGRLFGVGRDFVAYTQNDNIMLYFWGDDSYSYLAKSDENGRLSSCSVADNQVVWYANDPKDKKDVVKISTVER